MNRRHQSRVDVECQVLDETPKAICIRVQDGPRQRTEWIPLSCVHEIHRQDGRIVIDEWIAVQKDLM